ncbi:MAG: zinc protease [Chthoniobacter sp.]|jgi:zinc protease|nr:zinc protease [Chthoniobacter sp.]
MRGAALFATALALATIGRAVEIDGLPQPAELRETKFTEPREKTLANGLRVIVVERPGLPLVSAGLVIKSGAESDPAELSGLASFTAALLTQGTTTRSATQIAREVEALGATLKAKAAWDGTVIELTTLSAQADPAFALLADVARHPKFAPAEIERLRRQTLDELRVALEEPGTVAALALNRVLLGAGLYAHPPTGTPASIKRLRREAITGFHASRYAAGQALLIVAGNLTADSGFAIAEKHFGDWAAAPAKPPPAPGNFEPKAGPRAVLIDLPTAGQAAVVVGVPCIARGAEDYFAGEVANSVLGGGYSSRLNQEIRVKRGLTYGAASALTAWRAGGICSAHCQTKNVSAAEVVKLVQTELDRLGSEAVPPDFLVTRQTVLVGGFARELETNTGYVKRIADFAVHDLPLDSLNTYLHRIREVTASEVRAFGARYLSSERVCIVVAGRAQDCAKSLRELFPKLELIPQSELDLDSPTLRKPSKRPTSGAAGVRKR